MTSARRCAVEWDAVLEHPRFEGSVGSTHRMLRLFAARPDHPVVAALYLITAPVQALAFLDASQPRFGATLELSTLALFLLILCVGLIIGLARRARARGKR